MLMGILMDPDSGRKGGLACQRRLFEGWALCWESVRTQGSTVCRVVVGLPICHAEQASWAVVTVTCLIVTTR